MSEFFSVHLRFILEIPLFYAAVIATILVTMDRYFMAVFSFVLTPIRRKVLICDLIKEIKLHPNNYDAYQELGYQWLRKKNYWLSLICLSKVVRCSHYRAEPHYYLGVTYLSLNMRCGAIREFAKSLSLNPKGLNGRAFLKLAECQFKSGNKKAALVLLGKALDWFPESKTVYEAGILYNNCGDYDKAESLFKEVILDYHKKLPFRKRIEWKWVLLSVWHLLLNR